MTPQPPRTRKAAAPTKGAAARAETTNAAKTVTFRDATLTLPPELPATMLFDVAEIEAAGQSPMPVFRLLRSLLGPDQFLDVRHQITEDDDVIAVIDGLLNDIFSQYGISLGE